MEQCFELLQDISVTNPSALQEDPSVSAMLDTLIRYYEGGQWLRDYELDEQGLLPPNLKRGVLAQDSIFDFLDWIRKFV